MGLLKRLGFISKKEIMIPAPTEDIICKDATPYKTLATFDITLTNPRFEGDIPDATIKFYSL